jgi:hypothetical protein
MPLSSIKSGNDVRCRYGDFHRIFLPTWDVNNNTIIILTTVPTLLLLTLLPLLLWSYCLRCIHVNMPLRSWYDDFFETYCTNNTCKRIIVCLHIWKHRYKYIGSPMWMLMDGSWQKRPNHGDVQIWTVIGMLPQQCVPMMPGGVDLNRNFPFQWGIEGGSSSEACSPTARGSGPASEPGIVFNE